MEARYYGKLGETVKENFCRKGKHCSKPADADRPNAVPGATVVSNKSQAKASSDGSHDIEHDNDDAPLYVTQYRYDTFGRLQRLVYPDGEILTYGYDAGGLVNSAVGVKGRFSYPYLKRLDYDKFDQRVYLVGGNNVETSYTYRQDNRRLVALQAQLPNITHYRFQNLAYRYDNVGNILGVSNTTLYPEGQKGIGEEVGGPVSQNYVYDDLYRLTRATGEYRHETDELRRYRLNLSYDSIHNIRSKEQLDEEVEIEHGKTDIDVQEKTSYTWSYQYQAPQIGSNVGSIHPHAPSDIGPYAYQYDSNGNQIERRQREEETTRQIIWDEDNRMVCVHEYETEDHRKPRPVLLPQTPSSCTSTSSKESKDGQSLKNGVHSPEVRFTYNDRGERVYKESHENVSFYLNPHYTEKSDNAYKHILIGTTRLATKEVEDEAKEHEDDQYYYHPDHLGSSSFVTDHEGKLEEHLEYFPFGETWVEEESSLPIAFQFTAKELDSETGLYYFGARYYDPRTSVWQSADPILAQYLEGKHNDGVFHSANLGLYSYSYNMPVVLSDPDGNCPMCIGAAIGAFVGTAAYVGRSLYVGDKITAQGAFASAAVGAAFGSGAALLPGAAAVAGAGMTGYSAGNVAVRAGDYNNMSEHDKRAVQADAVLTAAGALTTGALASKAMVRPATQQGTGGGGRVLADGEGATRAEIAASTGGPTGGSRSGASTIRGQLLNDAAESNNGVYTCWRCGQTTTNPANMHLGHRNVPVSQNGNLSSANVCLEGAACNLSAGNRGNVSPGMSCADRGGCGAPYGRTD